MNVKKIVTFFLSVLMVVSCICALSPAASAEDSEYSNVQNIRGKTVRIDGQMGKTEGWAEKLYDVLDVATSHYSIELPKPPPI